MTHALPDHFRRDQKDGVTAPDLSKSCELSEHIVRARGKRTRFTSLSLDKDKIDDFGPALYVAHCEAIVQDGHGIVEHGGLIGALRASAASSIKHERVRALRAIQYATRRKEALVSWNFDISSIERKELVKFGFDAIQKYFGRA